MVFHSLFQVDLFSGHEIIHYSFDLKIKSKGKQRNNDIKNKQKNAAFNLSRNALLDSRNHFTRLGCHMLSFRDS